MAITEDYITRYCKRLLKITKITRYCKRLLKITKDYYILDISRGKSIIEWCVCACVCVRVRVCVYTVTVCCVSCAVSTEVKKTLKRLTTS